MPRSRIGSRHFTVDVSVGNGIGFACERVLPRTVVDAFGLTAGERCKHTGTARRIADAVVKNPTFTAHENRRTAYVGLVRRAVEFRIIHIRVCKPDYGEIVVCVFHNLPIFPRGLRRAAHRDRGARFQIAYGKRRYGVRLRSAVKERLDRAEGLNVARSLFAVAVGYHLRFLVYARRKRCLRALMEATVVNDDILFRCDPARTVVSAGCNAVCILFAEIVYDFYAESIVLFLGIVLFGLYRKRIRTYFLIGNLAHDLAFRALHRSARASRAIGHRDAVDFLPDGFFVVRVGNRRNILYARYARDFRTRLLRLRFLFTSKQADRHEHRAEQNQNDPKFPHVSFPPNEIVFSPFWVNSVIILQQKNIDVNTFFKKILSFFENVLLLREPCPRRFAQNVFKINVLLSIFAIYRRFM